MDEFKSRRGFFKKLDFVTNCSYYQFINILLLLSPVRKNPPVQLGVSFVVPFVFVNTFYDTKINSYNTMKLLLVATGKLLVITYD